MSKFAFVEVQRRLRDDIPYAIYMNCRYMYDTLVSGTRIQSLTRCRIHITWFVETI